MKLNINQEFVGLLSNDEEYEMYANQRLVKQEKMLVKKAQILQS